VGIFSVASRVSQISLFLIYSFQAAWSPFATSIHKIASAKQTYSKTFNYYVFTSAIILWFLTIGSFEIVKIMTPGQYLRAYHYVFLLGTAWTLYGLFSIVAFGTMITKKTTNYIFALGAAVTINIIVSLTLGREYGMLGVSVGNIAGWIVALFIINWLTQKQYEVEFAWSRLLLTIFPVFGCWLLLYYYNFQEITLNTLLLKIGLTAGYLGYLYLLKLIPLDAFRTLINGK